MRSALTSVPSPTRSPLPLALHISLPCPHLLDLICLVGVLIVPSCARAQTPSVPLQISAGGPAVTPYVADTDYSGGSTYSVSNSISTTGVASPAPQSVYQHERNGTTGSGFTYTLPGLTPGTSYTLRLHFSENYCTEAGQREFNVSVNGTQVLSNFDIYQAAGGEYKAIVKTFPATANPSGQIVVAFTNGAANYSKVDGLEVWGTPPAAPTGLTATPGNASVSLSWGAVSGASGYNVYRSTASGSGYTKVNTGAVTSASYTDTSVTNGTAYYYVVTSLSAGGESAYSTQATATPSGPTPLNVTATGGDTQALVTWAPVPNAVGYNVYRSGGSSPINAAPVPANAYLDTGLTNGTTYTYTVAAIFSGSTGTPSSPAASTQAVAQDGYWTVTPPASPVPATPAMGTNTLSLSQSVQTALTAEALAEGTVSTQVSTQAEANCAGTWTFTWTGSTWPTLYVVQHTSQHLYSALVQNGTGTATVSVTGGSTLATAQFPSNTIASSSQTSPTVTYNTTNLMDVMQTVTSSSNVSSPLTTGSSSSATIGWSDTISTSTVMQNAYTQSWFESQFPGFTGTTQGQQIVLMFTIPKSDVTSSASLSNSTSTGFSSGTGSVSDMFAGR